MKNSLRIWIWLNLNYLYKFTQERNSATLLLSALVTRIFGVPRSKSQDQLSWKNKMTGRIFFQRYPKLFEFFQQELRKASQSTSANLHPSLYPVLLILGRLYPSSLEGTDSNVQVSSRNTCHKSSFISFYFSNHSWEVRHQHIRLVGTPSTQTTGVLFPCLTIRMLVCFLW